MKQLLFSAFALAVAFGLSSCCCLFSNLDKGDTRTVTKRVCGYDTVVEEIPAGPKSGAKGGVSQLVEHKVPRYRQVEEKVWCNNCWRFYCADKLCCGTTGPKTRVMASAQGHSGSPNIGLIPTMKPLVP